MVVVPAVACSPTSSGAQGVSCTQDTDCGPGLQCLSESLPSEDGGCTGVGMECLLLCSTDAECVGSLGAGFECSKGPCGAGTLACQPVAPAGDGGSGADARAPSDGGAGLDGAVE